MTSDRWQRIETLFQQALEASAGDRPQLLEAIGDAELRQEVESLLHAHRQAGAFLEEPDRFFSNESFEVDTLSPGQVIDRYRIVREIGRGGMGAVFLAERADDEYQKQVALKLIKRGTDTDSVLRHFRNERQILAGFDHANIARLFDGGTTESGLPYFVMEYVEGLPIDEYCTTQALPVAERLKLFREVCAAVSYAHRRLVIHRDIKRSNILVTAEGVPKLLDFGIAKLLQEDDAPQPTMTALHLMTPQSASPEQLRGQPVTTATDVYSLGVVLYELLCGQSPYQFSSQSPHDMARVITDTEPTKPSTAVARGDGNSKLQVRQSDGLVHRRAPRSKGLKGDLDNIVLMALRKEPERRYQSVEQFSEDIRRHLEARPVLARKDTVGYRAAKFARRNTTALAAAAIVLLILVSGIVATSRQAQIAFKQQARAERRFNDVRKLANNVLFDYHDAIKDLPGATKVRERLVQDGLNYLDSLAGEAQGDRVLQRELADAYDRVGDVRGGTFGANLGDLAGAMESYTKAFKIREALVAANPGDTQARRDLARSHLKLGRLQWAADAVSGEEHLWKARTFYLELTRVQPADPELQLELADTCEQLGRLISQRGDFAGALEQSRAALAAFEKLVTSNPRDQRSRRKLWSAYGSLSDVLRVQGDAAGAMEAKTKELAIGESLLAEDPINTDYRRGLALTYQRMASLHLKGDKHSALQYYRRALALNEELLAVDPASVRTHKGLAYEHMKIAGLLADDLHDNSQALFHFSKALESCEKLIKEAPGDLVSRFLAITCRAGMARARARLGEVDFALEDCARATTLLAETAGDKPGHIGKAQAYTYVGYAYLALAASPKASASENRQHTSAARDMLRRGLDVLDDLRNRQGTLGGNEPWAQEIAGEIAKCDAALKK